MKQTGKREVATSLVSRSIVGSRPLAFEPPIPSTSAQGESIRTVAQPELKMRPGPSGIHFFCRETGLNVLCDEVREPCISWAAAPRQVSIALTNACDLTCPYCYAPKNYATL